MSSYSGRREEATTSTSEGRREAAASSLAASRTLLRQVIRQIHPDRFGRWPEQRAQNADALKVWRITLNTQV